ncbi:MAG: SCO family protein [Sphingomonadales bacterium]|nr:SCO family protein [Sphingomonadales bacterium]
MKKSHLWGIVLATALLATALSLFPNKGEDQAPVRTTGTALIGGDFTLEHASLGTMRDAAFRGRFMLVYFGYTFCPDVCPVDVQKMALALDLLEERGIDLDPIQPIFITLDPERDTAKIMQTYASAYHPRIMGLAGTPEQIDEAKKAYKVYSRKALQNGSEDYLVDHSNYIYLMGPDGVFLKHFTALDTPASLADSIEKHMALK